MHKILLVFLTTVILGGLVTGSFYAYKQFTHKQQLESTSNLVTLGGVVSNIDLEARVITLETESSPINLIVDNEAYVALDASHPNKSEALEGPMRVAGNNVLSFITIGDKIAATAIQDGSGIDYIVKNLVVSK